MAKEIDFYKKLREDKYAKYNLDAKKIKDIGDAIGINWDEVDFGEFAQGVKEELEHGDMFAIDPSDTNVTNDDINMTAKIAWAHLKEVPDYYTRLEQMEEDGEEHWEHNDFHEWIKENRAANSDILADLGL
jgi:hypothetical protein